MRRREGKGESIRRKGGGKIEETGKRKMGRRGEGERELLTHTFWKKWTHSTTYFTCFLIFVKILNGPNGTLRGN